MGEADKVFGDLGRIADRVRDGEDVAKGVVDNGRARGRVRDAWCPARRRAC